MAETSKEDKGKSPPQEDSSAWTDVPSDEDDLDDLDDMLDEFSTTKHGSKLNAPEASGPGRPAEAMPPASSPEAPELTPEDFAEELQNQMAALMGEIDESPEMRQQVEAMMRELVAAAEEETSSTPKGNSSSSSHKQAGAKPASATAQSTKATGTIPPTTEDAFQQSIRKTMERMAASSSSAPTSTSNSDDPDDILTSLISVLATPSDPNAPPPAEEDLNKLLMGMMEHLTNKDILYDPLKDFDTRFPEWMRKNEGKLSAADLARYREQQVLVRECVEQFERRDHSDDNVADREFVLARMQKMQTTGAPPTDLVGDMEAAQEALGGLDAGCGQQ